MSNFKSMLISCISPHNPYSQSNPFGYSRNGVCNLWAIKLNPSSSQGHAFIITIIKYFTKWVEVIHLKITIGPCIIEFIHENLIWQFRILSKIIWDNYLSFKNKEVWALCEKYHNQHSFSNPYYLQEKK